MDIDLVSFGCGEVFIFGGWGCDVEDIGEAVYEYVRRVGDRRSHLGGSKDGWLRR